MDHDRLARALNALSNRNRLALFEAIAKEPDGITTTQAAERAGTLLNTATMNLKVLEAAGLVASRKDGRSVTHKAIGGELEAVIRDLTRMIG